MAFINLEFSDLKSFVDSLPLREGTISENVLEAFGVEEPALSFQDLHYISTTVFDCGICQNIFFVEFLDHFDEGEDMHWCKWCTAEEPFEIAFAEGAITAEHYDRGMKEAQR